MKKKAIGLEAHFIEQILGTILYAYMQQTYYLIGDYMYSFVNVE